MQLVNKQEDLGDFSDEQIERGKLFELEDIPARVGKDLPSAAFIHGPEHTTAPKTETVTGCPLLAKGGTLLACYQQPGSATLR